MKDQLIPSMNKIVRGLRMGACLLLIGGLGAGLSTPEVIMTPAAAQQSRAEQAAIRKVSKQVRPLPSIVREIRSQAPYDDMDYLGGPEFDPARYVYRLKFMEGSKVVFVYVDAVSGRIIGRSR